MSVNELNDNIEIGAGKHLDDKRGGSGVGTEAMYADVAEALAAIPSFKRAQGLVVVINDNGTAVEYWFRDGIGDGDLVLRDAVPAPASSREIVAFGTNPTAVDANGKEILSITSANFTASSTLTFSNIDNLVGIAFQLTNTNANTLTFAGITIYFKTEDLPDGVTFAANALTFPADSSVKYNLVGEKFDGSTFDCKIEIR